jgi:putative phosphoesterase
MPPPWEAFLQALRLGLISDTHVPDRASELRPQALAALDGVDQILHAGDLSSPAVVEALERLAPVVAVRGNNLGDWTRFRPALPRCRIVRAAGWRLGMHHGMDTLPQRLVDWVVGNLGSKAACARYIAGRVAKRFAPGEVDAVVYGHAHWPLMAERDGVLFLNPGQAYGDKESSLMLIDITQANMKVRLVLLGTEGKLARIKTRELVWSKK